jgi:hypothetical protein
VAGAGKHEKARTMRDALALLDDQRIRAHGLYVRSGQPTILWLHEKEDRPLRGAVERERAAMEAGM